MSIVTLDHHLASRKLQSEPFTLRHGLTGHRLFTLARLAKLVQSLPRNHVRYNHGKMAADAGPESKRSVELSATDVIRSIETAGAWMVIRRVEEDPEYRALLLTFVAEANRISGRRPDAYLDLQGFIFISSPGAITPFHIDAEENILIQIHGEKIVHTFDNSDRALVAEKAMELTPSAPRDQHYEGWFESRATLHALKPGDGVYMPYMLPNSDRSGSRYSISMAMTWKTPEVQRLNKIRRVNASIRKWGVAPSPPGLNPSADRAKVAVHDTLRVIFNPLLRIMAMRRIFSYLGDRPKVGFDYSRKPRQAGR
jgi:hypothetical protein